MNTEIIEKQFSSRKNLKEIHTILTSPQGMLLLDLDGTIKEAEKYHWPDGEERRVVPEAITAFRKLHQRGIPIGVATEQAFSEIEPFLTTVTSLALGEGISPYSLFNGIIIGEGGNVIRKPAKNGSAAELVTVAPKGALSDRKIIFSWLQSHLTIEWGLLPGVNPEEGTLVAFPPEEDQGQATISLWEKGPHFSEDASYEKRYRVVRDRVNQALQDLQITTLTTYEAGNGTLRIVPRRVNKAHTVELLAAYGVLNRSRTVYICDGPNDIALAEQLKLHNGSVIAVKNAVSRLHSIADYATSEPAGKGFGEIISKLFSENTIDK